MKISKQKLRKMIREQYEDDLVDGENMTESGSVTDLRYALRSALDSNGLSLQLNINAFGAELETMGFSMDDVEYAFSQYDPGTSAFPGDR